MFARAGLASDIEVVEEFPARYDVGALRHHRWARGDWRLLPWILGRAPVQAGAERATRAVPAIGRWKMLDNLRRTLSAPRRCSLCLRVGLAASRGAGLDPLRRLRRSCCRLSFRSLRLFRRVAPGVVDIKPCARSVAISPALTLSALTIAFLADQACLMADAVGRTLWRLGVTRDLLEWVPAAQATIGPRLDLLGFTRRMAGAIVVGVVGAVVALAFGRGSWPWRFRSPRSGSPRRPSRAGSVCLPARPLTFPCRTPIQKR